MAAVRTFNINPTGKYGVPDQFIAEWLTAMEKQMGIVRVHSFQAATQTPSVTFVVTKLDDPIIEEVNRPSYKDVTSEQYQRIAQDPVK